MKLSQSDHERIIELAEKGWKPGRIAQVIGQNSRTVAWFMYSRGLKPLSGRPPLKPYTRNGRVVRQYTAEEDAFIQVLRVQNFEPAEIARITSKRFGSERTPHSVANRLLMLAATEEVAAT